MSNLPIHPDRVDDEFAAINSLDPIATAFVERLQAMGVNTLVVDASGELMNADLPPAAAAIPRSELVETIRLAAARWSSEDEPAPWSPRPDLTLVPTAMTRRRRRIGYFVACMDGSANPGEVRLLWRIMPSLWRDHSASSEAQNAVESFSRQLSGVYEELTLVYKLSGSLHSFTRPERFVAMALEELHATLPFESIAACFAHDPKRSRALSGQTLFVGPETSRRMDEKRAAAALSSLTEEEPCIFTCGANADIALGSAASGDCLAQPVMRDGAVIGAVVAIRKGGDDPLVSSTDLKLVAAATASIGVLLENATLYDDQRSMFMGTLRALTSAIDAKDRYTRGHSERVAYMATRLGEAIGLDTETTQRLHIAGLVHDVGKIGVPEAVLCKPGRLTDEEFSLIKLHPEIGHRILKDIPQLADVLPGVLSHHERWDGKGYPHGIKGEAIPMFGRLIAIADSFDAMSSTRTYRSALDRDKVLTEIEKCGGTQFDPQLSRFFVGLDFAEYDRMVSRHKAAEQRHPAAERVKGEAA